jgi:hypothetical protein
MEMSPFPGRFQPASLDDQAIDVPGGIIEKTAYLGRCRGDSASEKGFTCM